MKEAGVGQASKPKPRENDDRMQKKSHEDTITIDNFVQKRPTR